MARLRVSFTAAVAHTKEQVDKFDKTLDEAAHQSSLIYNENKDNIIEKILSDEEKLSRKTGKIGRPPKKAISNQDLKIKTPNRSIETYTYSGLVTLKTSTSETTLHVVIDTDTSDYTSAIHCIYNYFYSRSMLVNISASDMQDNLRKIKNKA